MENSPSVLFDGLVLPDGEAGVKALASVGQTMEFITNQYRHGKTIVALGAAKRLLESAGVKTDSVGADPGLLVLEGNDRKAAKKFISALAMHRHPERETDPPRV